ncbi:thiol-disulfide oxidoreductase DCC family protein [Paenibacillus sp. FJAT-26967]|uniref:thiol-disulfide oxidoreductase DCC family protein n=1 Tax=Paenibacillus sp. FJAT-26967 TaxID=1729690 RepID=UPI000A00C09C|nr:thiol-disulfide oxidoreductase DCC family protein [Paenibacillus sp. FJAT-26967]
MRSHTAGPDMDGPVVLFDGVCNLCNSAVMFTIRRDPHGRVRFAALQSDAGQRLLARHDLPAVSFDTFVLVEGNRAYMQSTAGLRVLRRLRYPWPLLYGFIAVPKPLRDAVYRWVARNRYRWFGQREQCMMPTPELRRRFLE